MCMLCHSKILVGKLLAIHIFDIRDRVNLNSFLPHKIIEKCRLCPQSYEAKQTLARKFMEPSFFSP